MRPHEVYKNSRPKVGQPVTYRGKFAGLVRSVEGNLCWVNYFGGECAPFIWCFKDGLNNMHTWPGKDGA